MSGCGPPSPEALRIAAEHMRLMAQHPEKYTVDRINAGLIRSAELLEQCATHAQRQ